jgi:hypothetical protein
MRKHMWDDRYLLYFMNLNSRIFFRVILLDLNWFACCWFQLPFFPYKLERFKPIQKSSFHKQLPKYNWNQVFLQLSNMERKSKRIIFQILNRFYLCCVSRRKIGSSKLIGCLVIQFLRIFILFKHLNALDLIELNNI